jgi:hypothetical protein
MTYEEPIEINANTMNCCFMEADETRQIIDLALDLSP